MDSVPRVRRRDAWEPTGRPRAERERQDHTVEDPRRPSRGPAGGAGRGRRQPPPGAPPLPSPPEKMDRLER
jgi:hypothetical protein